MSCIVCRNWTEADFRIEYDHHEVCGTKEYLEHIKRMHEINEKIMREKYESSR
jgi:hypothetical protein